MSVITFYLSAIERFAKETLNFEKGNYVALLTDPSYRPLVSDHKTLADVTGELTANGYDRQTVNGKRVDIKSGVVVFAADDLKFLLKEETLVGYLVVVDMGSKDKPLVFSKNLMNGEQPYRANPGVLVVELKNDISVFEEKMV